MEYSYVQKLSAEEFRRLTGVKPTTFEFMVKILLEHEVQRKSKQPYRGGRKPALDLENTLLLALSYLREYRTMFHTTNSFKVCESGGWRALRFVENTLIKNKNFALLGKKALLRNDINFDLLVIDATETPCERPKKGKNTTILARKSGTR